MGHDRNRLRTALFIGSGIALVGVFLAWMLIRNHEAVQSIVGKDSAAGWATQVAAVLVLLAGVALLARGAFVRDSDDTEEIER
ncbi:MULTISPECIES: hypothetical protein [Clavibacter]|uniref:Uncharacterized protein n=2 Tax=Clavibacter TaxID=1573 RepID=A0A399NX83_9MICO|nr:MULTISPECIES: hypothetical protein [Clavibacter]KDP91392.1 hypothetical protein W824_07045 [Clavibacter cf. michiganensis LMG 26808]RII97216.1 hypothetical protein DZF96_08200 [Clavibacter michiganensis]UKF25758.1 hypothetical protein KYT88_03385 [Clavibacter sp. A6099]